MTEHAAGWQYKKKHIGYIFIMVNSDALKEGYLNGKRYTYADYKNWELAESERFEIIYGEAYAMAAPNLFHQSILVEMIRQIGNFLVGKPCKVYPAPFDVRLFYEEDESDDTVVQPDIVIICDDKKRGEEGCRGAPDFVAEILSPSNTAIDPSACPNGQAVNNYLERANAEGIDMQQKFRLYREAGVREYWIIDPKNKVIHVHLIRNENIFPKAYDADEKASVEILPGLVIDLKSVFAE